MCESLADFKDITGTNIRLCLPDGELIGQYVETLNNQGYTVDKISVLEIPDLSAERDDGISVPISLQKTIKATAKDALSGLNDSSTLLISGPSNFTRQMRHELLNILGF